MIVLALAALPGRAPGHPAGDRCATSEAPLRAIGESLRQAESTDTGSELRLVSEGVVLDPETGLLWERGVSREPLDGARAEQRCRTLDLDGLAGWRLPTREELLSLVDASRGESPIDLAAFPATPPEWYWSATPFPGAERFVWGVSFEYGGAHYLWREGLYRTRCVRTALPGPSAGRPARRPEPVPGVTPNAGVRSIEPRGEHAILRLEATPGETLPRFESGQTLLVGLPDGDGWVRRRYTATSVPSERGVVELLVRRREGGAVSTRLHALRPGAPIHVSPEVRGPRLAEQLGERDVVLVATGVGIAHFLSWLRSEPCTDRRVTILQGGGQVEDLWLRDELEGMARRCDSWRYVPVVRDPSAGWHGERGPLEEVARRWTSRGLDPARTRVALCANPGLIESLAEAFGRDGFRPGSDLFWCEAD